MWEETVRLSTPYDFDYTLIRFSLDPLSHLSKEERWVLIPVQLGDEQHVVHVEARGTREEPEFVIRGDSEDRKKELLHRIHDLFQWDIDLGVIQEHFMHTNLAQLFTDHPHTPIVKDYHPYDCLMKTIIHQQLNMKFAYTLSTRFVKTYGNEIDGVWFYPTPERVADIPYEELRELQFSQRKAEYVIDTSRKIVNGELDLNELTGLGNEEVMKKLTKIRGIGPWTVENWLLFGAGRADFLPKADIGIQNALKRYFELESKPKHDQIDAMSPEWTPYKSYASLTLWRSIEG
ncbi:MULTISPECIES: DNA-3-methyladenine glycosylase family protein [Pontibacillus]|uniref:DNA-3-methyladenine glycosylase II n=1 Tax=Pontibacillus chungwhensis TaxID=265426 RepID=A0ABY8UZ04_9BACI|nr:DNA-3-methyladenine glycosylase [Pontibacillus chungwhensis]MCD5325486.1 DNA-3-methyladenine glycosylase [Pontibacillus sp. HN14]WIF98598.1 DNA-3-methyladenine glycosylase [Pontibacillus chungwhensis]